MQISKTIKTFICMLLLQLSIVTAHATTKIEINTPREFNGYTEQQWRRIGQMLVSTNYDVYVLNWGGTGGYINIGKEFIYKIQQAQQQGKYIIIKLRSTAVSMHAVITCYANKIIYNNNNLMFHADDNGAQHKRVRRSNSILTQQFNYCANRGILSSGYIDLMWQGNEIYVMDGFVVTRPDRRPLA